MKIKVLNPESPFFQQEALFVRELDNDEGIEAIPLGEKNSITLQEGEYGYVADWAVIFDPEHPNFKEKVQIVGGMAPGSIDVELESGERISLAGGYGIIPVQEEQGRKAFKHFRRAFRAYKAGRYYGYHLCCTGMFCFDVLLGLSPGNVRHLQLGCSSGCPVPCGIFHKGSSSFAPLRRISRIIGFYLFYFSPLPAARAARNLVGSITSELDGPETKRIYENGMEICVRWCQCGPEEKDCQTKVIWDPRPYKKLWQEYLSSK